MRYALPSVFGSIGKIGDGYKCDRCGCVVMSGQTHWCPMTVTTYPYPWGGVTPPPNWYPEPNVFIKIRQMDRAMGDGLSGKTKIVDGKIVKTAPPGEAMRSEDV